MVFPLHELPQSFQSMLDMPPRCAACPAVVVSTVLISMSTVFMKRHSVIDVYAARVDFRKPPFYGSRSACFIDAKYWTRYCVGEHPNRLRKAVTRLLRCP